MPQVKAEHSVCEEEVSKDSERRGIRRTEFQILLTQEFLTLPSSYTPFFDTLETKSSAGNMICLEKLQPEGVLSGP
jgi:hypothetical protein